MGTRYRNFFDPREVEILYAAIDRALDVLRRAGVKAVRSPSTDDLLARGVLKAARSGRLEITRLSDAACVHWVDSASGFRSAETITIH